MSPNIRDLEDRLASIESTASEREPEPDEPGDRARDRELSERQSAHLDKILDQLEDSEGEQGDRLAAISETIREEKADESPEERRARRENHELTDGERALLDLLTGGSGEVRR